MIANPVANPAAMLDAEFGSFPALIAGWGAYRGEAPALFDGTVLLSWRETADQVERIAAALQAGGLERGQAVAILGTTSVNYALIYLAAIRAGGCAAPLTTSASNAQLAGMAADSGAAHLFIDRAKLDELGAFKLPVANRSCSTRSSTASWPRRGRRPRRLNRTSAIRSTSSIRQAPPEYPRGLSIRTECAGAR